MSSGGDRLLSPGLIPPSLWDSASGVLSLPPTLAEIYERLIDVRGLRELADRRGTDESPVGGHTQERTDQHFAQAFDGSVARTQLALIDPKNDTPRASNAFFSCLAGNRVSLTDAPCGAGAAAFGFLATIAELRAQGVVPRQPLDIHLIGAELSEPAREYARTILDDLRPFLEEQAITVEGEFVPWDVSDALSNTDLITRMTLSAARNPKRLLVVANFSGFLARHGKLKEARPRLEELLRHASGRSSVAIWIEPNMKLATGKEGLLPKVWELVKGPWQRFVRGSAREETPAPIAISSAKFLLPLKSGETARVTLAVVALDLVRGE